MQTVKVINERISLPPSAVQWIAASNELSLFIEGDTLILKRLHIPRLSEFAAHAPDDEMPLDEIVAEVHRHRQESKDRAGRS